MKQRSFASLSFESKKKPTRRERFLGEMDKVVPWEALLALIEPSYPTSGRRGRPPVPAGARRHHVAHPLHATVVHAERSGDGRRVARDRVDAPLCRAGVE